MKISELLEHVELDRSKNPNYPNDPATIKHRIETAKSILSDPLSGQEEREQASAILAQYEKQGVAEGWKEDVDDMGAWAEKVRTKLLNTPQQQRWAVAKQLSQIEVKNFGSELVQRKNYDPKTGKPVASERLFTQIVQDTLKALNTKPVTGGQALDLAPSEMHKPDDRDGQDWVIDTKMGWLSIPNAGKAPARVKKMLWRAFNAGPEIYPLALEIFEETGDFTEQDYKDCIVRAAEARNGGGLEAQAYQQYNQQSMSENEDEEADYGDEYQATAKRAGEFVKDIESRKSDEQKSKEFADLVRRLNK